MSRCLPSSMGTWLPVIRAVAAVRAIDPAREIVIDGLSCEDWQGG